MTVSPGAVVLTVAICDKINAPEFKSMCYFFLNQKKSCHGETKAAELNSVLISEVVGLHSGANSLSSCSPLGRFEGTRGRVFRVSRRGLTGS